VAKNVAGYDVSRLMVGALGILGVLCDVSLKVLPAPVATVTRAFDCSETEALRRVNQWRSKPLPIDASSWHGGVLCVRFAGAQAAVIDACHGLGGREIAAQAAHSWWTALRDHRHEFFNLSEDELQRGECLWRLSLRASAEPLSIPARQLIEWQGAQRWCRTEVPAREVRAAAALAGGHATLMRAASKSAGVFTPLSEALMHVHRRLKQAFDPKRIFNRGRMYAEL
jgi:glycolate oxidase FAD binding subunit